MPNFNSNNNNLNFEEIYNQYRQEGQQRASEEINVVPGKEQIVAVRKNEDGDIIAFRTDNGRDLDYVTALNEAKSGNLAHVDVFHKYGRDIIRSEPDGFDGNNLDNLPTF
ncbi:DUF3892 domain-containing protein [Paenibacillus sp. sptzw28]|uniref:DUF3892 domain-containing protein n=1 Tax=Paenibacillus sp. sptzw28 TaxID=715179 RepID=UPI001C6E0472|nr:DUF3892 domain-containing protein [Paenibacillus sp. sptzw28]QYR19249.1 DUF3892 domain-containing protein [Paenibacillus sp. sptzw28]